MDDHYPLASEAKHKACQEKQLKILTPNYMLQRLLIAPTKLKADNTLGRLLNEIRQLFIFYIEQKKSLKKYVVIKLNQYKYKRGTFTYFLS